MALPGIRPWSFVAAAGLSLFTLLVFYELRDYGPESAVRRFHQDLLNRNLEDLQKVTAEPIDSAPVNELVGTLAQFYGPGAPQPQTARTERFPRQVNVVVLYRLPSGGIFPVVWVVDEVGHLWKVDADKTLVAFHSLHGG